MLNNSKRNVNALTLQVINMKQLTKFETFSSEAFEKCMTKG